MTVGSSGGLKSASCDFPEEFSLFETSGSVRDLDELEAVLRRVHGGAELPLLGKTTEATSRKQPLKEQKLSLLMLERQLLLIG